MMYECEHECQFLNKREYPYLAVTSVFVLKAFHEAGFSEVKLELDPKHPCRVETPERVGYFHIRGVKASY